MRGWDGSERKEKREKKEPDKVKSEIPISTPDPVVQPTMGFDV
jgi:hypothetical protein